MAAQGGLFAKDAFGHRQLGGVADYLQRLMQDTLDALASERRLPVIG